MLNKVQIIGNVGQAPEIRAMISGDKVATFTVATSDTWKDKQTGEKKEKTEWHRIACFNQHLVKIIEQFLKKGSKLYLEGKLQTRKYEKNGENRYVTEIVMDTFGGYIELLDKKEGGVPAANDPNAYGTTSTVNKPLDDDNIPF
jgi:single-strand DNA-binding protein